MHNSSMVLMTNFMKQFQSDKGLAYDVGSYDVNGNYRDIVEKSGFEYIGIDARPGPNVDLVLPDSGRTANWETERLSEITISGQCLEHVKWGWIWIENLVRITKPGGRIIVIAPNTWGLHRHPRDCIRIWPDGLEDLFEWANIEPIIVAHKGIDTFGIGIAPEHE